MQACEQPIPPDDTRSSAAAGGGGDPDRQRPRVQITYYTDPLCAWSWSLEPAWRRLRFEFGDQLDCRYRLAGLLPGWNRFHDPVHAISRPGQMAPLWLQIAQQTGAPLDERLWSEDPPDSSFPACLAVKAAELQGAWAGEAYLRRLREAAMLHRRNPARPEILREVAEQAAGDLPPHLPLNVAQFWEDYHSDQARQALRDDVQDTRCRGIERFPSLLFHGSDGRHLLSIGYRSYDALRAALQLVAPAVEPRRAPALFEYAAYWNRLTRRELAEALQDQQATSRRLEQAIARGELAGVELVA